MSQDQPVKFRIFHFMGQPRFGCPECSFDSYDAEQTSEHYKLQHAGPPAPFPVLFDGEGKRVTDPNEFTRFDRDE